MGNVKNQKINNDTVECVIKIKNTLCPCDSYFGTRELEKLTLEEQTKRAKKDGIEWHYGHEPQGGHDH